MGLKIKMGKLKRDLDTIVNKMDEEVERQLTCTICKKKQEFYSEIVYSQGSLVCLECKKDTQYSDDRDYDSYIATRHLDLSDEALGL